MTPGSSWLISAADSLARAQDNTGAAEPSLWDRGLAGVQLAVERS